jgi:ABC-type antimicrobial peptide transport system permease subunit
MVLREAVAWTVSGAAIGLALAAGLTRFLQSMLYGISPTDPWTFAAVVLTLAAVASTAALLPALKAARVDPLVALRNL